MKMLFIPPLEKGDEGGFFYTSILHKISPFPSLPKRGIFGAMTIFLENRTLWMDTIKYHVCIVHRGKA
jgi:hypothetical protein